MKFLTNGEDERCHRLLDVLCFVGKMQGELNIDIFRDIQSMEDSKGHLYVSWYKKPNQRAMFWFMEAWSSLNENFESVTHLYPGYGAI